MYILTGGIQGIGFTLQEHRGKKLQFVTMTELSAKAIAKDEVLVGESSFTELINRKPYQEIGKSHVIVLRRPYVKSNV